MGFREVLSWRHRLALAKDRTSRLRECRQKRERETQSKTSDTPTIGVVVKQEKPTTTRKY